MQRAAQTVDDRCKMYRAGPCQPMESLRGVAACSPYTRARRRVRPAALPVQTHEKHASNRIVGAGDARTHEEDGDRAHSDADDHRTDHIERSQQAAVRAAEVAPAERELSDSRCAAASVVQASC